MMYRLTTFGEKKFSVTVTGAIMWYLGKGTLAKNWSSGFSKPLA